jgi:hypothetical protein
MLCIDVPTHVNANAKVVLRKIRILAWTQRLALRKHGARPFARAQQIARQSTLTVQIIAMLTFFMRDRWKVFLGRAGMCSDSRSPLPIRVGKESIESEASESNVHKASYDKVWAYKRQRVRRLHRSAASTSSGRSAIIM